MIGLIDLYGHIDRESDCSATVGTTPTMLQIAASGHIFERATRGGGNVLSPTSPGCGAERELSGLRNHEAAIRDYGIPRTVLVRLGAR